MSLYQLADNYATIQRMIEEGADPEALADTLESIDEALEDKVENIYYVLRNIEGDINAIKAEEHRLAEKRRAAEKNQQSLKDYLKQSMERTGKTKIKRPTFTVGIQKNPPSVDIENPELVPKHFFIAQDPKLDKKAIIAQIKAGEEVPGAVIKQTESIRIR
ncbi:siphovirus Gp157 family protein [Terribacillus sp. 179-K 1B1 HS]|uniref:siphovirus Gp157 family protein n=1 Tax=Terribacillus sp. 179-K 1B1 HS TaxID=3142388 RepID=UPI0039A356B5